MIFYMIRSVWSSRHMVFSRSSQWGLAIVLVLAILITMRRSRKKTSKYCKYRVVDGHHSVIDLDPTTKDSVEIGWTQSDTDQSITIHGVMIEPKDLGVQISEPGCEATMVAPFPRNCRITCRLTPIGTCVLMFQHIIYMSSRSYTPQSNLLVETSYTASPLQDLMVELYQRL
jgi:hypothetical protein